MKNSVVKELADLFKRERGKTHQILRKESVQPASVIVELPPSVAQDTNRERISTLTTTRNGDISVHPRLRTSAEGNQNFPHLSFLKNSIYICILLHQQTNPIHQRQVSAQKGLLINRGREKSSPSRHSLASLSYFFRMLCQSQFY